MYSGLHKRKSGTIVVEAGVLRFTPYDPATCPTLSIAFESLAVRISGTNNTFFVFSNQGNPETEIYTTDANIAEALVSNGYPHARKLVEQLKKTTGSRWARLAAVAAALVTAFMMIPWTVAHLPTSWINSFISFDQERFLGTIILSKWESSSALKSCNSEASLLLHTSLAQLKAANQELSALRIDVCTNRSSEVNAFAIPGGILVVNEGLLKEARSIEEVIGVLSHELGHIERRHVLKAMASGIGVSAGISLMSLAVGSDLTSLLGTGTALFQLKYSREHEQEADTRALQFLRNAKISAQGLIDFFERIDRSDNPGMATRALNLVSTHPQTATRIQNIKEQLAKSPYETLPPQGPTLEEIKAQF